MAVSNRVLRATTNIAGLMNTTRFSKIAQVIVLDRLRTTVEEGRSKGEWPPIDLILVTGDVAFSGGGRPSPAGKAIALHQAERR